MKSDLTHITVVLDRSGSMASVRDDTIGGFNVFLADQKKLPGDATMTLVEFDAALADWYLAVFRNKPLRDVPELTRETFVPRGGTALLDAMGRAITETGDYLSSLPEAERPGQVVVVVMTDGGENASRTFTRERVFEMVRHQTDTYSWRFVFLGANQDAIQVGGSMGILRGQSLTYAANHIGTKSALASMSGLVASYRAGYSSAEFTAADRKAQSVAGA